MIRIHPPKGALSTATIHLPLSKSVINRELILAALAKERISISSENLPEDVRIMNAALSSESELVDIGHAGTAMRFCTAYFALSESKVILTGSERMQERPIKELVVALNKLGADIRYKDKEGYPPLEINPSHHVGGAVSISGETSSQYISALLLVGCAMEGGLELSLIPPITSRPYIDLTLAVLKQWGVPYTREGNLISISASSIQPKKLSVVRDWSAAAFYYGLVATGAVESILFPELSLYSAQGDKAVMTYYEKLGVRSEETSEGIKIVKEHCDKTHFSADLKDHPDLAQAIAFTCAAMGLSCSLTGLETLRIKETDRIAAIEETLIKVGCHVEAGPDYLQISGRITELSDKPFKTYDDHRMGMSIPILALGKGSMFIEEETVVKKSFPGYWEELKKLGFTLEPV